MKEKQKVYLQPLKHFGFWFAALLVEGQCHLIFCVTLNGEKTHLKRWNRQNNGSVLLTINLTAQQMLVLIVWLQMNRMEIDCN